MKQIIFVLGMHRTGTSLLTACIYHMLDLNIEADSGNLMKATNDNPKGYFEDVRIVNLNEKILSALGYSWDAALFVERNLLSDIPYNFFIEAKEILTDELRHNETFVVKDPRVSLLLPFWTNVVNSIEDCNLKHIVSLRNPYETALSEFKRASSNRNYYILGHKLEYTQRVWFTHYYEILKHTSGDFLICEFEKLIDDPHFIIDNICQYLKIDSDKNSVTYFVSDFLSKDLRRNKIEEDFHTGLAHEDQFIFNFYQDIVSLAQKQIINREDAKSILQKFIFIEQLKDYFYPLKEFPLITKRYLIDSKKQEKIN